MSQREKKALEKEKRRLERLKKDLSAQQSKLDKEKARLRQEKKDLEAAKKKLANDQKFLKARQKSGAAGGSRSGGSYRAEGAPIGGGGKDRKIKQLEKELKEYKNRYNDRSKQVRDQKDKIDQLEKEMKVLRRKLKSAENASMRGGKGDDRSAGLEREVKNLRRQLRLALKDLDKQKRYYTNQLKRFQTEQERWLAKQREMNAKKGVVVKYMFLDDIRAIKIYPKRDRLRHKCRVTTAKGEVTTVWIKDVQHFDPASGAMTPRAAGDGDAALDAFIEEMEDELMPERAALKKKRKRKMKTLEDGTMVPATPMGDADEDAAFGFFDDGDMSPGVADASPRPDEDSELDDDYELPLQKQVDLLTEELVKRTSDLHRVCEVYCEEPLDNIEVALKDLLMEVIARHTPWVEGTAYYGYDEDELEDLAKKWQDEIGRLPSSVETTINKKVEEVKAEVSEASGAAGEHKEAKSEELETILKQKDAFETSTKQLMDELSGRVKDLKLLNAIYFHPDDVQLSDEDEEDENPDHEVDPTTKRKERLKRMQQKLGARHTRGDSTLHDLAFIPEDDIVDGFATNNQIWRSLIGESSSQLEKSDHKQDAFQEELIGRTKDLEKVVRAVSGDEPLSVLDQTTEEASARHEKLKLSAIDEEKESGAYDGDEEEDEDGDVFVADNNHWRDLIIDLKQFETKKREKAAEDAKSAVDDADFKDEVIDDLLNEMKSRRLELLDIRNTVNPTIPEECEAVYSDIETRHEASKSKLRDARKKETDETLLHKHELVLEKIAEEQKLYEDDVKDAVKHEKKAKVLETQEDVWLEELDDRINDLLKVKSVTEQAKETAADDEAAKEKIRSSVASILESVKSRHDDKEQRQEESFKEAELMDDSRMIEHMSKYKSNDSDWRDALSEVLLDSALSTVMEEEEMPDEELPPISVHNRHKSRPSFAVASALVLSADEKEPDMWWLDKDKDRVKLVDSIAMKSGDEDGKGDEDDDEEELKLIGGYIQMLFEDDDDPVRTLYTPQPKEDKHHIASALYDAELCCELIGLIDPDIIDARVIHKPDPFDPHPLSDEKVLENAQLLYSACHALGCHLESDNPKDWCDPAKHMGVLKEIISEIHHKMMDKLLSVKTIPELFALQFDGEEEHKFKHKKARELMRRWLNEKLGRDKDEPLSGDYSQDLYNALTKTDEQFSRTAPCAVWNEDKFDECIMQLINYAHTKGVETNVVGDDLALPNTFSQELFAAQVIAQCHGLPALSDEEKKTHGLDRKPKTSKRDHSTAFVNSLLPEHLHVADLSRDLQDGLVLCHLVDKLKPGSIDWRRVKKKVKNKFDMMGNCKYGMSMLDKHFNFSLVGISGQDIHEGKMKFVNTVLWQMMRYHSIKKLSELSFGGKDVTDEDILQWANLTISGLSDRRCNTIKSLRDKHLTSCIYYLELCHAILPPDTVRTELVYYDVPMLASTRAIDDFRKERLANARYAMTLVRMNGGELFVLPEDLIALEPKAVLSMLASLMTIALTKPAKSEGVDAFSDLSAATSAT